jgi:hypothetical protein
MVFERDGRAEHRHQPVAGELVHRAAVAQYRRRRPVEQLVHDFAQPFRFHSGGKPHGLHHIREQNRDLLAFEGCGPLDGWRAARITKSRECSQVVSTDSA